MAREQRRARLSIDLSPQARRRIRIAAAGNDQTIREYVWEAVEARLKKDLPTGFARGTRVALTEKDDRVLAALWKNSKDSAYDKL